MGFTQKILKEINRMIELDGTGAEVHLWVTDIVGGADVERLVRFLEICGCLRLL